MKNVRILSAIKQRSEPEYETLIASKRELQEWLTSRMRDSKLAMGYRLKAVEYLCKTLALFTDNVNLRGALWTASDAELRATIRDLLGRMPESLLHEAGIKKIELLELCEEPAVHAEAVTVSQPFANGDVQ